MKKSEIEIGARYTAKVSGKIVVVRIHNESEYGGWNARSELTGKWIRVKSAMRLRARLGEPISNIKFPAAQ